jgi:hypothetical protein
MICIDEEFRKCLFLAIAEAAVVTWISGTKVLTVQYGHFASWKSAKKRKTKVDYGNTPVL